MSIDTLFLQAAKKRLRFVTDKGVFSTEDLFDLPLLSAKTSQLDLDTVAKSVNRELQSAEEDSFVERRVNPARVELQLKLDIVKAIIEEKQADNARKRAEADIVARRAALKEALNNKQAAALEGLSEEQIRAELANLGG